NEVDIRIDIPVDASSDIVLPTSLRTGRWRQYRIARCQIKIAVAADQLHGCMIAEEPRRVRGSCGIRARRELQAPLARLLVVAAVVVWIEKTPHFDVHALIRYV